MKKLIWALTALIIISTFFDNFQACAAPAGRLVVTLESTTAAATTDDLRRSGEILRSRLEAFGLHNVQIQLATDKGLLKVSFEDTPRRDQVLELLTAKGAIQFCALASRENLTAYFGNNDNGRDWQALLHLDQPTYEPAAIGAFTAEEAATIRKRQEHGELRSSLPANIRLAWSYAAETDHAFRLYALKLDDQLQPIIDGRYIQEVRLTKNEQLGNNSIMILFNNTGARLWLDGTTENIDRPVAMVIDRLVYMAPRVMNPIATGDARITGNFTIEETEWLAALIGNGELPVDMKIVRME